MFSVDGKGWVMREWSDDVRLGMMSEWSPCSFVELIGRASEVEAGLSRVAARLHGRSRREGPIVAPEGCPEGLMDQW